MTIYNHGIISCDNEVPLHSSIGRGPRGDSVSINVIEDSENKSYRLQFLNARTSEVLATTPNMDPGARVFACNRDFETTDDYGTYESNVSDYDIQQPNPLESMCVGDLVLFRSQKTDGVDQVHDMFGIGIIDSTDTDTGTITFTSHFETDTGLMSTRIQDGSVTTGKIVDGAVTYAKLADNSVTTSKMSDGCVTPEKLSSSTLAQIGSASDEQVSAWLDNHPDATTTVTDGSITTAKLADGAVTYDKLGDNLHENFVESWNINDQPVGRYCSNSSGVIGVPSDVGNYVGMADKIACQPETVYALSCNNIDGTVYWCFYEEDGTFISRSNAAVNTTACLITTPEDCKWLYVFYYRGGGGMTLYDDADIQITEGAGILPYSPHLVPSDNIARSALSMTPSPELHEIPLKFSSRRNSSTGTVLSRAISMYVPVKAGAVVEFNPVGAAYGYTVNGYSSPRYEPRNNYYDYANQSGDVFASGWQYGVRYVIESDCYVTITASAVNGNTPLPLQDAIDSFRLRGVELNNVIENNRQGIKLVELSRRQPDNHPVLTLMHITDIHGDVYQLSRAVDFFDAIDADDIIHTGDMADETFYDLVKKPDGTSTSAQVEFHWWDYAGAGKVLNCIGNHDLYDGDDWSGPNVQPSTADAFDRYFAPYYGDWGVVWGDTVTPSNAMYYYKDYVDPGIRLIVLDENSRSDDNKATYQSTQVTWFEGVLADAITEDLAVIVAQHYPFRYDSTTRVPCSFTSEKHNTSPNSIVAEFSDAVDQFVLDGGEFVCWIAGHLHNDIVQLRNDHLLIDCTSSSSDPETLLTGCDLARSFDDATGDCFNVITVDRNTKRLTVIRIGADHNYNMRPRKAVTFNYLTCAVVYDNI